MTPLTDADVARIAAALAAHLRKTPTAPALLSRRDAAAWLGLGTRSVDSLIFRGDLKTRKVGGRRLVPMSELRRYAAADHPSAISPRRREPAAPEAGR